MIGSLRGVVLDRAADGEVLVEVAGVGYRVTTTPATLAALSENTEAFLHVHHHVREDAQQLFGFATGDERRCFEALLGAHGVGPALALAILSVHGPHELRLAVATGDVDALTLVPGVGKKTATRLLLELEARLDVDDLAAPTETAAPAPDTSGGSVLADVRQALASLGYGAEETRTALRDLPEDGEADDLLRRALQTLGAP